MATFLDAGRMLAVINRFDGLDLEMLMREMMGSVLDLLASGRGDGGFTPRVLVLGRHSADDPEKRVLSFVYAPFDEWADKASSMRAIGVGLYRQQLIPLAAVLASKAWLVIGDDGILQPRDHPGRRDVAVVMGSAFNRRHHAVAWLDTVALPLAWSGIETKVHSPLVEQVFVGFADAANGRPTPRVVS